MRGSFLIFFIPLTLFSVVGYFYSITVPPKGDELHFLITAISLTKDHDWYLENNYDNRDYAKYYPFEIDRHSVKTSDGHEYLYHGLGLFPILVSLGYAVAERTGASLLNSLMAALLIQQIYFFTKEITKKSSLSFFTTLPLVVTLPFAQYSFLIFPEIVGAVIIIFSLRTFLNDTEISPAKITLLGLLPWINLRFLPVAVLITTFWIIRTATGSNRKNLTRILIPVLLFGAYFIFLRTTYGSFLPSKPYDLLGIPTDSGNYLVNFVSVLIDRQYGLFIHSPIFLLSVAGMYFWAKSYRRSAYMVLLTTLIYAFSTFRYYDWNGGYSPPGRYLTSILPLWIPAIAIFLQNRKNISMITMTAAFWFWGGSSFITGLMLSPNHGFVYRDGTSPFLFFISQKIGWNIHGFFPAYYPNQQLSMPHYFWIVLTILFLISLVTISHRLKPLCK